jgi:hypothetical protein
MNLNFSNRANTNTLSHQTDGILTSWGLVSFMVLDLIAIDKENVDVQISTNTSGKENTVLFPVSGTLIFDFKNEIIAAGDYLVELASVNTDNSKTQLIHPDRDSVYFKIISTKSLV